MFCFLSACRCTSCTYASCSRQNTLHVLCASQCLVEGLLHSRAGSTLVYLCDEPCHCTSCVPIACDRDALHAQHFFPVCLVDLSPRLIANSASCGSIREHFYPTVRSAYLHCPLYTRLSISGRNICRSVLAALSTIGAIRAVIELPANVPVSLVGIHYPSFTCPRIPGRNTQHVLHVLLVSPVGLRP